jgi:hypothetical protein
MMGRGGSTNSSLQIAKTAIYLPAIAVTASGAQIFKKQAKGESTPYYVIRYSKQFTGHGRRMAPFDKALAHLEPAESDLKTLMSGMDIIARYWLEMGLALWDIETRVRELRDNNVQEIRIQGLSRDWTGVAKDYLAYYSLVCVIHYDGVQHLLSFSWRHSWPTVQNTWTL